MEIRKTEEENRTTYVGREQVSMSWAEVFESAKKGEWKKLWPIFFVVGMFIFVGYVFGKWFGIL